MPSLKTNHLSVATALKCESRVNIWNGERAEENLDGPGVYQFNRPDSFGAAPALLIVRALN
jgi:hypothetical protein